MNDNAVEQWRFVPGFEGFYSVSDQGRVKSIGRVIDGRATRERVLKKNFERYEYVFLCREGRPKRYRIHTLVLTAFVGPRPKGNVARHLDSNPMNNSVANLSWGTPKENMADERRRGFGPVRNFKLSINDAIRIMGLRGKMTQKAIAQDYGVSQATIHNVHTGKAWRVAWQP